MTETILHTSTTIDFFSVSTETILELPIINNGISAGFPSPALDFVDKKIDLNQFIVKNPTSTFYGRVKGYSLKNIGIDDGDIMVIDRSIEPKSNQICICFIDGEFTAKRILKKNEELWLLPENDDYQPIKVEDKNNFIVWGVVTFVVKAY